MLKIGEFNKSCKELLEIFSKYIPLSTEEKENKLFYGNILWSFFGGIVSGGILFSSHVIAGRLLGPDEFGRTSFIIVGAQLLFPLLIFGSDTAVARELATSIVRNKQKSLISSTFFIGLVSISIFSIFLWLGSSSITSILAIQNDVIVFFIMIIVSFSLKYLLEGFCRGLQLYKKQSLYRIFEAIIIIIIFLCLFFFLNIKTYQTLIIAYLGGSIFLILAYFSKLRSFIHFKDMRLKVGVHVLQYGKYVVMNLSLSSVFLIGDRIIINKYLGDYVLGLYAAYHTVSMLISGLIAVIVGNVFFVFISRCSDKEEVARRIGIVFRKTFLIASIIMGIIIYVGMLFFGEAYDIHLSLIVMFSMLSVLYFFSTIYTLIVMSHSHKSYKLLIGSLMVRAVLFVLYIVFLVRGDVLSIEYVLIGLIVNFGIDILVARTIISKFL